MAKEYEKFLADYGKLKSTLDAAGEDARVKVFHRFTQTSVNVAEGEGNLKSALTKARKSGVTGDSFDDFGTNKDFQEALKLIHVAVSAMDKEIEAVDAIAKVGAEGVTKLAALHAAIKKDLSARRDSSDTKKKIEELRDKVSADHGVVQKAAKLPAAVEPFNRDYAKNFQKRIAGIIKEDAGSVTSSTETNDLPQKLVDRNLKRNFTVCVGAAKSIKELCDSALTKDGKGDRTGAVSDMKQASEKRKELHVIAADYVKIQADFRADIDNSKDAKIILQMVAKMKEFDDGADRQIRDALGAFKKAG